MTGNKAKRIQITLLLTALVLGMTGCGKVQGKTAEEVSKQNLALGVSVHDPSVVKADGEYYIFGSHMEAAESKDLLSFHSFASGVNERNPLFDNLFEEGEDSAFSFVGDYVEGGYAVWAPDVIYNEEMGKWVMYFSTSHDYCTSSICMAVADDVKGPYTYQQVLISSGFTSMTVDKTNFYEIMGEDAKVTDYLSAAKYNNLNYPNCIDPTVFYDKEERMWMVYGSWSGGIWLLELDKETGLPIHPESKEETHTDRYFGQYLMGGLHNSCEGPYLFYDSNADYYYLLVSYGGLTREGGYQIRAFRSKEVTGPYLDAAGKTFDYATKHGEAGLKMMGNYMLPSLKTAYMAPGHCSALTDEDGKMYLVYHQRFDGGTEYHEPRVHQMFLNEEDWPVAAPFAAGGESLRAEGYREDEIAGRWYLLNHELDISAEIHKAEEVVLKKGKVSGEKGTLGSYELSENTCYMTMTIQDVPYSGVLLDMQDEAGNAVRCFMGAGTDNKTVWAVMYL